MVRGVDPPPYRAKLMWYNFFLTWEISGKNVQKLNKKEVLKKDFWKAFHIIHITMLVEFILHVQKHLFWILALI